MEKVIEVAKEVVGVYVNMAQIIKDTVKSISFPKVAALGSSTNQMPFVTWDGVENIEIWGAGDAAWDTSVSRQDTRRKFGFEPERLRVA